MGGTDIILYTILFTCGAFVLGQVLYGITKASVNYEMKKQKSKQAENFENNREE